MHLSLKINALPIAAAALLTLTLGLTGCFPPPDGYYGSGGPPRYGYGGTESPRSGGIFSGRRNEEKPPEQGPPPQGGPQNQGPSGGYAQTSDPPLAEPADPQVTDPGTSGGSSSGGSSTPSGSSASGGSSAGASSGGGLKYGRPVPGRPGYITSPDKPDAGYIEILVENPDGSSGVLPPGTKIEDPFTGKPILVP